MDSEELGKMNEGAGEIKAGESEKAEASEIGGEPEKVSRGMSKKQKIILAAVCGVAALVLIILAVVLNLPNGDNCRETNCAVDDGTSEEGAASGETGENTTLSAGTVTTTIGGKTVAYKGAYVVDGIEATISTGEYVSTSDDEVAFLVINGGKLTIDGAVEIKKSGSADFSGRGDEYSFYGTNSAVVVVGEGSTATLDGVTITTTVSGANAVVATDGGEVEISNAKIATTEDNSRGLHATYAGVITADTVEITTEGGSCATLATDRGEGTVTARNMTLSTAGSGSPLIYSTGKITVADSTGTAKYAQIAVVEGKNSVELLNCEFSAMGTGNRRPSGAQYPIDNAGVMIYQSMSGDADTGTGSFSATDSTLSVLEGTELSALTPFFFVTNTTTEITLTNTTVSFNEEQYFLVAAGTDEWGRSGANGGIVTITSSGLTATNTQIGVDAISSVTGI